MTPPPFRGTSLPTDGVAKYLVVFLHGVGDSAEGFAPVAHALQASLPHAELLVPDGFEPYDAGGDGRQWFSRQGLTDESRPKRVKAAGQRVSQWLDAELEARGLGPDRVVLVGFSQGAIVSLWLATHRRPAPLAVVALSGRQADDEEPAEGASSPVLMIHGARDAVIPVSLASSSAKRLEETGVTVTLHLHPNLGHGVDERVLRETRAFLAPLLPK